MEFFIHIWILTIPEYTCRQEHMSRPSYCINMPWSWIQVPVARPWGACSHLVSCTRPLPPQLWWCNTSRVGEGVVWYTRLHVAVIFMLWQESGVYQCKAVGHGTAGTAMAVSVFSSNHAQLSYKIYSYGIAQARSSIKHILVGGARCPF